jgi:hypothetical protein
MEQLLPRESGRYLKTILGNVNVSILDTKGRVGNYEILGFMQRYFFQSSVSQVIEFLLWGDQN